MSLLAVIMPTYNGARYLHRALDSIRIQNSSDLEVIAIDDGSTDDTLAILSRYQSLLPLTIHQRRIGNWAENSNLALAQLKTRWACFLHQDDFWYPGRLETLRKHLQPGVSLVLHASEFVDEHDRPLGPWRCPYPAQKPMSPRLSMARLLVQNFIGMPAPLFSRELAQEVGGLDPGLWYTADWDLWLKLMARGSTVYLPQRLAAFRIHSLSQTASRSRTLDDFRFQMETITRRHFEHWPESDAVVRRSVRVAAQASVEVNLALAAAYHRLHVPLWPLLRSCSHLGFSHVHRFLRDSRIHERVYARLNAGLRSQPAQAR